MIRLPDLTHMQVKCTIHESKVDSLQRGMRARIRVQDHEFQGIVTSVAKQPEPGNWFSGNVKEYAAIVAIESDPHGLRPGMTAAVEILVANLTDVLSVPVQAVVEKKGRFYCWVNSASGPQKHEIELGMGNNTRIEVKRGLEEGQDVLLNPRGTIEEAREEERGDEKVDVKKKFGDDKPAKLPAAMAGHAPAAAKAEGKAPQRGAAGAFNFSLKALDKNQDGKVTEDELPEMMRSRFGDMDKNSDGHLDAGEIAEVQKAIQQRMREMQQNGAPGGPGGP